MSSITCNTPTQSQSSSFGGKTNSSGSETESTVSNDTDDYSADTYGTVHTFQTSVMDDSPLRKVPPVMKGGQILDSPPMAPTNDTPTSGAMITAPRPPSEKIIPAGLNTDNKSDCSVFSGSICSFTSFDPLPQSQNEAIKATVSNDNALKEKLYSQAGMALVSSGERSSSLFSLCHSNIEKLYTATSIHENLALHVRCGFSQRQNSRKSMEDYITVCPSFLASNVEKSLPVEKTHQPKLTGIEEEDFAFFGVFDGHDGSYVSQYLQEHLMAYFHEKLLLNASHESTNTTSSPNSKKKDVHQHPFKNNKEEDMNSWRTSFLEAACKIDREILLQDSMRLQNISDQREAAFQGASSAKDLSGSDKKCDSSKDSFAGSTAAVVVVYRDTPLPVVRRGSSSSAHASATTTISPFSQKDDTPLPAPTPLPAVKETGSTTETPTLPPLPPNHEHEDTDNFHEDVVVGVFAKKDSAGSNHVGLVDSVAEDSGSHGHGSLGHDSNNSNNSSGYSSIVDDDVVGVFPGHVGRTLRGRNKKAMQRFSSTDSTYEAQAMELNLDDENALKDLENIINKQGLPFGKRTHPSHGDSATSNISDLTASYGNMSLLNSSEDLLHYQHAQVFNPKRKSLVAAVKRSYEENTIEDFSAYEGFQLEELVDDFLQRASMLDKAANDCRGQANELLKVLQQRVVSSSVNTSSDMSNQSSVSPYMSSIASNSISAQSGRSMMIRSSDDMSDISPNSGANSSNKSYSSLGSISSLKSFDDEARVLLKDKRSNISLLDTVTEGLFESRATSFAASRQASSVSANGSVFNEHLRLALMGEIASKNVKLLIAHAGDCRVVLCDGGNPVQVTIDHTPLVDEEKSRIKESGGFVSNKRVNGILAVSRSFGDIKFKSFNNLLAVPDSALDEKKLPAGIWNNRHQVISMPEILELVVLSSYEFVIIASDCVWETLTCSEVVHFARAQLLEHGDTMKAADALAVKVSDEGGMDNCSIIIVNLNQI